MKPSLLKEAIITYLEAGLNPYIHSSPGMGKSDIVRSVRDYYESLFTGFGFRDIRASQFDAVDTRGLPTVKDQTTFWCTPSFWPTEGRGIIFLDELSSAVPLTKAALYQLILDRCLGDYKVPDEWYIIAAGNLETDNAIVSKDGTALDSRFAHLYLEVDVTDWVAWALDNGLYMPLVAFIKFRPTLLHVFDPKSKARSFPCPRTVYFVSRLYDSGKTINPALEYELVSGIVGEGFTVEWLAFHRIFRSLPNPDMVLANPQSASIPTDIATLYALCGALAKKVTESSMDNFYTYLKRLRIEVADRGKELGIVAMQLAVKRDSKLVNTSAYIKWIAENQDVIF